MRLSFHGAAGEVTGSCARVDAQNASFLVDCGMFQGGSQAGRKNWQALDFDLRCVDFMLLTHAHLDHSGLIPRLVALGYKGPIYATDATVDLLAIMLLDSAFIQEKEAEWHNRHQRRRNARSLSNKAPLYTVEQARQSLSSLRPVPYGKRFQPHPDFEVCFREAGHILGSAIIEVAVSDEGQQKTLVFTGDLGQPHRPVLRDPEQVERADVLVIESTYGNRAHRSMQQTEDELVAVLDDTLHKRGGNVIIPAFAVGRTQEMIFVLAELVRKGRIKQLDIVVDSPMASQVSEVTLRHDDLWDEPTRLLRDWVVAHPERFGLRFVQNVEDSIALNQQRGGLVVISASGMCDAGRIKHHLRYNIARAECSIVICGFQAAGTLGRRLVDGATQVTLFGERYPVQAQIHTIGGLSAHADQPALLQWMSAIKRPPARTFIVHGEAETSRVFAAAVRDTLGWQDVETPEAGVSYRV